MARNKYYQGPPSDHYDGIRFFNPGQQPDKTFLDVLRWQAAGGRAPWPESVSVTQAAPAGRSRRLQITMIGHSTTLIQFRNVNILTDPVWSERASPLPFAGPRRVTAPGIAFDRLPLIDCVLLSHNHYDHLDLRTISKLHDAHRPLIVTSLGNDAIIRRYVPEASIAAGDWHDSIELGMGVSAIIVPANHWSARGTRDRRMALWSGFIIKHQDTSLYFAGDTGYGEGTIFRDIRARYGAQRFALLPIGAYEPRGFMASQHCNPSEAVRIMAIVGAGRALGLHWGTFRLTNEAREAPKIALQEALAEQGIAGARFRAAEVGSTYNMEDL